MSNKSNDSGRDNSRDDGNPKRKKNPVSPYYKSDDSGGYGNPPVSGQRQIGDPGGPGRKKGQGNFESSMRKALSTKILVTKDGKQVKLHPSEIQAKRVVEAILGPTKSVRMLEYAEKLFEKWGPKTEEEIGKLDYKRLNEAEFLLFSELLDIVHKEGPENCGLISTYEPPEYDSVTGFHEVIRLTNGQINIVKLLVDEEKWINAGTKTNLLDKNELEWYDKISRKLGLSIFDDD